MPKYASGNQAYATRAKGAPVPVSLEDYVRKAMAGALRMALKENLEGGSEKTASKEGEGMAMFCHRRVELAYLQKL